MKHTIFCYRNKAVQYYTEPQYSREDEEHIKENVLRATAMITNETEKRQARDMALYCIGSFDDITCKFDLYTEPKKLLDLEDYISRGDKDGDN